VSKDLEKEVKELNKRINELEKMISQIMKPLRAVSTTTNNYLRLTGLLLEHGGLTPDLLIPDIKDSISKEIIRVLIDRKDQNISQITEIVRNKRGTASRRIIRDRLKKLEEKNIVKKDMKGSLYVYSISESVIKKWSKMLGFNL